MEKLLLALKSFIPASHTRLFTRMQLIFLAIGGADW